MRGETMTVNDQIEAAAKEKAAISEAWNTYKVIRDPAEEPLETFGNGFRSGAEWGRREALRGLYVEVKSEECVEFERYLIVVDGEYWDATFRKFESGDFFDLRDIIGNSEVSLDRISKVYWLSIPSPADIFGEEG